MSEPLSPEVPPEELPTLEELFAADPLSLTKTDRRPIIEYYRSRRVTFLSGGKMTKAKEPKPKSGPLPAIDLDLGDLEL